ncbi:MAG: penicillin-binding protein 2 [Halanaerobiales bacterium]|nr:penicillin-binding protein 2 [Halanaerobiales bacterium]
MAISHNMERRTLGFGLIILMIFLILIGRLAYLQLFQGANFLSQAENNRVDFHTIGAPRGKILDSNGEILVANKLAYSASISITIKDLRSEDNLKKTIDELSDLLKLDRMELIKNLLGNVVDGKVILIDDLKTEEKVIILENQEKLKGITIEQKVDNKGNILKEYLQVHLRKVSTANLLKTCQTLSELFPLKYDALLIKSIAKGSKKRNTFEVKRNLNQEEMVTLEEKLSDLPGVVVEKISIRDYVYGSMASHVIGYMGAISREELQLFSEDGYRGEDYIGKTGLERYYESFLRGKNGKELIEVDSRSRKIRTLGVNTPLPGNNLFINIDIDLQQKIEELLDAKIKELREIAKEDIDMKGGPIGGAIIVMNPQNGKVLAMASNPDYDLNLFSNGISHEEFNKLNNDQKKPFTNRCISGTYAPGSIFKLVSAPAMLEDGVIDKNTLFDDPNGAYKIGSWTYKNWTSRGYKDLNIVEAIAQSNNVFFYKVAHQLYNLDKGGITLPNYARGFGLGELTGIDLPQENKGRVPDRDYKQQKYREIWYPGNSLHLSIGQWDLTTTPIQLINYVSAIGNGGKIYRPYIVDRIESYDGMQVKQFEPEVIGELPVSDKNLNIVKEGMLGVTTYGTARKYFADLDIEIAGKTGTAQIGSEVANHAWFAGFAPVKDPEIAILIFIEQGMSSSKTLPIAREIFKYYFNIPDPPPEEEEEIAEGESEEGMNADENAPSNISDKDEFGVLDEEIDPGFYEALKNFFKETFSSP